MVKHRKMPLQSGILRFVAVNVKGRAYRSPRMPR